MAVLPASKAYPRGGAPRRQYVKGAPLIARFALKFNGVDYPRGSELPIAQMSPHKHWELWLCGKADHALAGPFDSKPPPVAAPATPSVEAPPPATVQSPEASVSAGGSFVAESSGPDTMPIGDRKPGERVTFDPPPPASPQPKAERHGRRSR